MFIARRIYASLMNASGLPGRLIDDSRLANLLEEVETANDDMAVTFFEVTTAAAMLAFSRVPADLLLLETGLGGALTQPMY